MKITYPGPVNSVYIPALGRDVAQGETVDVKDSAVADQLVAQGWKPAPTPKPKAAPKAAPKKDTD